DYVNSWSRHFQVTVKVVATGPDDPRVDREIETVLYRIVQEALTNVAKHAHATHVEIVLAREVGEMLLTVKDDGLGFRDVQAFGGKGLGLVGVRERADLIGG